MFFLKNSGRDKKIGVYGTVAFHLVVLIVLLLVTISSVTDQETSFVLDFTRQDELEAELKKIELQARAQEQLEEELGRPMEKVRNTVVDESSKRDSRLEKSADVYKDAAELQKKLDASHRAAMAQEKADAEAVDLNRNEDEDAQEAKQTSFSGPSVLSYKLDGRKALRLPVPAYKGYGEGTVSVSIIVNRKGRVSAARVIKERSVQDEQLWELAEEAALKSVFTASATASDKQQGEIIYRFVRQ